MLLKFFLFNIFSSLNVYLLLLCGPEGLPRLNVGAHHTFAQAGVPSYPWQHSFLNYVGQWGCLGCPQNTSYIHPKLPLLLVYCPHCFWVQFLAIALSGVVGITKFAMCFVSWFVWVVTSSHSTLSGINDTFNVVFASWHLIAGKSSLPQLSANEHD